MTHTLNRDDLIQTLRPLEGWGILARGVKALESNDLETASYIYDYLTTRKRERFAKYFKTMIVNEFETYPIEFLTLAHEIAKKYESRTRGTHKVYVILLDGYLKGGRYGLYVGQTSRTVGNRLIQHLAGGDLAAKCYKKMRFLLPSLYAHIAPMSKKESLEIEEALANDFRAVGIRTEGGKKQRNEE
jgi:hypothetical protein